MLSREHKLLFGSVAVAAALIAVACSDMSETSYSSIADAKRDGAFDRGWLPDFLPEGTRNIREVHNIDTNETWSAFDFSPESADNLRAALKLIPAPEISGREMRRVRVKWWPAALQGILEPDRIRAAGFELYMRDSMLIAINWHTGKAFSFRRKL